MKPIISIIIPIFNCASILHPTIQSILAQTYQKFEIIFVDDASLDSGCKIIQTYKKRDKRIKLLKTNGEGSAFAKNVALQSSTGKYVMFFNAGQLMSANLLEYLVKLKEETNSTIVSCDFFNIYEENFYNYNITPPLQPREKIKSLNSKNFLQILATKNNHKFESSCSLFNKLIDKSILTDFLFDTSKYYSDQFAIFDLCKKIQKITISNQMLIARTLIDDHYEHTCFSYHNLEEIEFLQKTLLYFKSNHDKTGIKNTAIKMLQLLYNIRQKLCYPYIDIYDLDTQKENIDQKFSSIRKFLKIHYPIYESEYSQYIDSYKKTLDFEKFQEKYYYLFYLPSDRLQSRFTPDGKLKESGSNII